MELTVLVDNHTLIDRYFVGEPGLSFYIQDGAFRMLFDVGYSDLFLRNAQKMGLDLRSLDVVALSHGHLDHTWGLDPLIRFFSEMATDGIPHRRPRVVAHPETLVSVSHPDFGEFGSLLSQERLGKHFPLSLGRDPQWLTDRLVWLGQIPRNNDFEGHLRFGKKEGASQEDTVPDDSALAYETGRGLVIITGCAHAGVCNTCQHAKEVCNTDRILDIVGGLHLMNPSSRQLAGTLDYLGNQGLEGLHACHCTDLPSKIALNGVAALTEVGVGSRFRWNGSVVGE